MVFLDIKVHLKAANQKPGTPGLSNHRAIPGSPGMMDLFRRMGKKVIYVTNNAILPTEANVAKLTRLGYAFEKVRAHWIV